MCCKTVDNITCKFCEVEATVIRTCIDDTKEIYHYNNKTYDFDNDIITVRCDKPAEMSYICGWCVCYMSTVDNCRYKISHKRDHVNKCNVYSLLVVEYMIYTLLNTSLSTAEYSGICGYIDTSGDVVVMFNTYNICNIDYATATYIGHNKYK